MSQCARVWARAMINIRTCGFDFNWAPVLESFDDDSAASWVFALVTKWCEWIRIGFKRRKIVHIILLLILLIRSH